MSRIFLLILVAAGLAACAASSVPRKQTPTLRLEDRPGEADFGTVAVEGLTAAACVRFELLQLAGDEAEVLRIYTGEGPPAAEQPPLLGRVVLVEGQVRFRPRFPLMAGLPHYAVFAGHLLDTTDEELAFSLPASDAAPSTRVIAVHPEVDEVPSNLLRVYVHFSDSMHPRDVLRHVRLYEIDGEEVVDPFLDVENGLWDPACTRLTLFFHPGRVKRGIEPNETQGPPLQPDRAYRLVVDEAMEDARGVRLVESFASEFRTTAPDRESPDPATWELIAPAGASDDLELAFGEVIQGNSVIEIFETLYGGDGGGIDVYEADGAIIRNNLITNNTAQYQGAVFYPR